jgi:hypothetical protein
MRKMDLSKLDNYPDLSDLLMWESERRGLSDFGWQSYVRRSFFGGGEFKAIGLRAEEFALCHSAVELNDPMAWRNKSQPPEVYISESFYNMFPIRMEKFNRLMSCMYR